MKYHIPSENRVLNTVRALKQWAQPTLLSANPTAAEIEPLGAYIIQMEARPSVSHGQVAERNAMPTHADGVSTLGWTVRDMSAEELATSNAQLIAAIKAEANRRIVAICPEWKQRNLTAQAAQLAKKGEANWTAEESAAWAAGEALWAQIAAIRAASDTIEAMDPPPADILADELWP